MIHSFDTDVAKEFGVIPAIIIHNFQFWIRHNKANQRHQYDGRTWTYNSVKAFGVLFDYMTQKQIRKAIDDLVELGVVIKGNYNQNSLDKTTWFAFTDEVKWIDQKGKCICPTGQIDVPPGANANAPQGKPIQIVNHSDSKPNRKNPSTIRSMDDFKNNGFVLPWNDLELYNAVESWITHKIQKRDPLTLQGAEKLLNKLKTEAGSAAAAAYWINNSIANNWQGVHPPKQQFNNGQQTTDRQNAARAGFERRFQKYQQMDDGPR